MAVPMVEGVDSHRRVDPSTSVNRNVTVPDGAPTTKVSHTASRRAPNGSRQSEADLVSSPAAGVGRPFGAQPGSDLW